MWSTDGRTKERTKGYTWSSVRLAKKQKSNIICLVNMTWVTKHTDSAAHFIFLQPRWPLFRYWWLPRWPLFIHWWTILVTTIQILSNHPSDHYFSFCSWPKGELTKTLFSVNPFQYYRGQCAFGYTQCQSSNQSHIYKDYHCFWGKKCIIT